MIRVLVTETGCCAPAGTYNDKLSVDGICQPCPNGTTTETVGSTSVADCQRECYSPAWYGLLCACNSYL